jgi:lysyl-tRNA synthetase class 2
MAEVAQLLDLILGADDYRTLSYAQVVAAVRDDVQRERGELDLAFAEGVQALGPGRVFIVDYPADQAALARVRHDNPALAARFEVCVDGVELANGYWELGDRRELELRFTADLAKRRRNGQSQPGLDHSFLAAMEAGLPPCAGVAVGVDRLLMLLLRANSLADVMPFPADRA